MILGIVMCFLYGRAVLHTLFFQPLHNKYTQPHKSWQPTFLFIFPALHFGHCWICKWIPIEAPILRSDGFLYGFGVVVPR
jgi:hypothetical protein